MSIIHKKVKYKIGQVVRHKVFPFRGIIFDIDAEFNNTEEWMQSIPEAHRPRRDQPFYHLLAEAEQEDRQQYIAYVSEQNLVQDQSGAPLHHPAATHIFYQDKDGHYVLRKDHMH